MSHKEAAIREPLILGHKTYHEITEDVCKPIEDKAPRMWYILFAIALIIGLYGVGCIFYLLGTGIGVWGLNKTVGWAWDITNFVWWVGIGHAGTLISAVLLLFRQKWRMAINRSAEAMTIFAVFMAGLFPLIHMGRLWVGYWTLPLPNHFGSLWVNFNSPLLWDVFAISTYLSVSLVFWYIVLNWFHWCWPALLHHLYSRFTPLYPLTLQRRLSRAGIPLSSLRISWRERCSPDLQWS